MDYNKTNQHNLSVVLPSENSSIYMVANQGPEIISSNFDTPVQNNRNQHYEIKNDSKLED
jgi:hypothetical protein